MRGLAIAASGRTRARPGWSTAARVAAGRDGDPADRPGARDPGDALASGGHPRARVRGRLPRRAARRAGSAARSSSASTSRRSSAGSCRAWTCGSRGSRSATPTSCARSARTCARSWRPSSRAGATASCRTSSTRRSSTPGPRPDGPLRLLNVAALAEKKRHADLIDAVAGLDAVLEIVGDGELRGRAARPRAGPNVRFLGALPPSAGRGADARGGRVRALERVREPAGRAARGAGERAAGRGHRRRRRVGDRGRGRLAALVPPRRRRGAAPARSEDVAARSFDSRGACGACARERYGMEALGANAGTRFTPRCELSIGAAVSAAS